MAMGAKAAAFPPLTEGAKGIGKGKSRGRWIAKGKGPDNAALACRDASKGKGKGQVDDAFFEASGDGWALQYKWCLKTKALDCPYTSVPKGGPPMQTIYAFDVQRNKGTCFGTDVFFHISLSSLSTVQTLSGTHCTGHRALSQSGGRLSRKSGCTWAGAPTRPTTHLSRAFGASTVLP